MVTSEERELLQLRDANHPAEVLIQHTPPPALLQRSPTTNNQLNGLGVSLGV